MSGRLLSTGTLILVNREHPLPAEPEPGELAAVDGRHPDVLLHIRALAMLRQLLAAIGGQSAIVPVSGYRPRREQQDIWDSALRERGAAFTNTYVAPPGCSEHQTGLAIDLGENRPDLDFLCPAFPDGGVCGAFRQRAAEFGFILRYPAGKEGVTGIGHEPWHFRYVGWPHAHMMNACGLVLEEYLDWLATFPERGRHLEFQAGGRSFEVCYVPGSEVCALEERLPSRIPCQCSGTNTGGVVLTLWRDAG